MGNLSSIFEHQRVHNKAILDLLEGTTIGTNGAKYRHLHTAKKIADLHQPHYFTLYRHQKAMANITICERPMTVGNQLTDTFYIRYFAFHQAFQTKTRAKTKQKPSIFQQYAAELLATSNLDVNQPEYDPKIYWAIVDPENNRSLQMGERYGFEPVAQVKTTAFSRFKLRQNTNVSRAESTSYDEIWQNIQSFYSGYNGVTKVHLFKENNYFVLKKDNQIIAGIQANKVEWKIDSMPGFSGKLLVKLLPYIPFLRRIINPKKYEFLATEGLFWLTGYEHKVKDLLEGVLYEHHCHSMLIWTDEKDSRINSALSKTGLGLLQKVKKDNLVNVVAKFNQVEKSTKEIMQKNLFYISGFDCT